MSTFGGLGEYMKKQGWQIGEPIEPPSAEVKESSAAFSIATAIGSNLVTAYQQFAAARASVLEAKSESLAYEHQATMLQLDRRAAERRAQSILGEAQGEAARLSLEGGQRRGALRAGAAGRGIDVGSASAREAVASDQLIQDLESYHVRVSAVREANAARRAGNEYGSRAMFSRTSAANLRGAARAAAPETYLLAGGAGAAVDALDRYSYRRR